MAQISLTVLRCPDYGSAEQRQVRGVELTIGRGTECDWALPDPLRSLSRRHCRLEQVGAAWQVVDLSANGTFINFASEPIGRDQVQPLRDGDRLRLGDYELEVHLSEAMAPSPAAATPFGGTSQAGGFASPAPLGGFAAVRLPGLDDPIAQLAPDAPGDGLDLDISGGLGAFAPAAASAQTFSAQDDHAPATGDAFVPPAVVPAAAPTGSASGQGMVPDDWFHSIALGSPATAAPPPLADFSPAPAPRAQSPASSEGRHDRAQEAAPAPISPFGGPGVAPLPFDEAPAPATTPAPLVPPEPLAPPARDFQDFHGTTAPGTHVSDWPESVDVPLSGPGPRLMPAPVPAPAPAPEPWPAPVGAAPAVPVAPPRPAAAPVMPSAGAAQPTLAALSTLFAGAGLPPETLYRAAEDPEAALRHAGAVMQVAVSGLRALLVARGMVKREFRIEQTMLRPKENNPLKFAASDEHALAGLLDPRTAGLQAVQEAVDDLSTHEVAVLAATQAAARALLERLSPAALEAEDPGGSGLFGASAEKRLWGAYKRRHETLMAQLDDDFDSAFGTAFARAYEQAVGGRKR